MLSVLGQPSASNSDMPCRASVMGGFGRECVRHGFVGGGVHHRRSVWLRLRRRAGWSGESEREFGDVCGVDTSVARERGGGGSSARAGWRRQRASGEEAATACRVEAAATHDQDGEGSDGSSLTSSCFCVIFSQISD